MLKNLRNKMYKYIDEYGLNSEETLKISQEVDLEINNYYRTISLWTKCFRYSELFFSI